MSDEEKKEILEQENKLDENEEKAVAGGVASAMPAAAEQ